MAGYGPLWRIDGPPPLAPLYGLLGAARVVDDVDAEQVERWMNGVSVYPFPDHTPSVWDTCAAASDRGEKDVGDAVPTPVFGAMTVYLGETCSSFGIFGKGLTNDQAQERYVDRAKRVLAATESHAVESEFMSGAILGLDPNQPYLADGNGTFPWGDNATSVVNGFALLEGEIAASGRQGLIHVSPMLAVAASAARVIERDDRAGVLRTVNGTVVVPGTGYAAGATPASHDAAAGTEEWAYASGPVEVRRSEIFQMPENLSQALDRETNDVTYYAERHYLVDWDTAVQAAVLIDRCSSECGSAPA